MLQLKYVRAPGPLMIRVVTLMIRYTKNNYSGILCPTNNAKRRNYSTVNPIYDIQISNQ